MSMHLPAELQKHVDDMMTTGRYQVAGDVIVEALYMHRDQVRFNRMKHEELKREVMLGIEQTDRGEVVDGEEFVNKMLADIEAEERRAAVA